MDIDKAVRLPQAIILVEIVGVCLSITKGTRRRGLVEGVG